LPASHGPHDIRLRPAAGVGWCWLGAAMDDLATRGLLALSRPPTGAVERLAGASGSGVYRLGAGAGSHVLKVTEGGREDARRELTFYRELADTVPVRTPRFVDGRSTDDLTVLLLTASRPGPAADTWDLAHWLEVAGQLGSLHKALDRTGLDARPWLHPEQPETGVASADRLALWTRSPLAPIALPLLADLERLRAALYQLPACLVHGDCHAHNLLRDVDGQLVWADWAQVGVGRGPEEFAILWQRAEFDGASVPREPMVAAYAATRGIDVDDRFRDALTAAELLMILLGWPAFLLERPSHGRDVLFGRFEQLAQG
jgi:Ser/Thr protein kinase RdoA (MazF antagonist)